MSVAITFALLALIASGVNASGLPSSAAPPRLRGTVVWPPGTRAAFPFALKDQNGRLVTLTSLRGRVAVVTFLDAHCTQACPVAGRDLAMAQNELGGRHSALEAVIIDINPAKDTPSAVRAFVHRVGLVGNWHWLLGSRRQLASVWRIWGTYVKATPRDVLHTAALYLVDQHGFVRVADEVPFRPDQLAGSVRALLGSQT